MNASLHAANTRAWMPRVFRPVAITALAATLLAGSTPPEVLQFCA
ncbi:MULTISPECIES: hypothetical protein [unclassified Streptosporangium]|nr:MULTISPECIES: hypothetical protein [unclassified Streptosporangium]